MSNEIPTWWLILSGAFFAFNLLFLAALTFLALRMAGFMQELKPKVDELNTKVNALIVQVQDVTKKVEAVANQVSESVNEVSGRAKGVVGSAELVAQSASRQFEKFSPFVVGAVTAMRLVRALNDIRGGRNAKEATRGRNFNRKPKKGLVRLLLRK